MAFGCGSNDYVPELFHAVPWYYLSGDLFPGGTGRIFPGGAGRCVECGGSELYSSVRYGGAG